MRHWLIRASLAFGVLVAAGCATAHRDVAASPSTDVLNGRSIFETGVDLAGRQIVARRQPMFSNCAACHRVDGSGGVRLAPHVVSADLRYDALVTQQSKPYTLALLERAISTGIDNTGAPLDPIMPRWNLSPRDLHDVATYVLRERNGPSMSHAVLAPR